MLAVSASMALNCRYQRRLVGSIVSGSGHCAMITRERFGKSPAILYNFQIKESKLVIQHEKHVKNKWSTPPFLDREDTVYPKVEAIGVCIDRLSVIQYWGFATIYAKEMTRRGMP